MANQVAIQGHDNLVAELKNHSGEKGKAIYVLFSGSADENGQSWCADCVKADPIVEAALPEADDNSLFILCEVGQKDSWKDPNNLFRTDPDFKLSCIPTLMKLENKAGSKHVQTRKLQEAECANADLVKMLFTED